MINIASMAKTKDYEFPRAWVLAQLDAPVNNDEDEEDLGVDLECVLYEGARVYTTIRGRRVSYFEMRDDGLEEVWLDG